MACTTESFHVNDKTLLLLEEKHSESKEASDGVMIKDHLKEYASLLPLTEEVMKYRLVKIGDESRLD